MSVQSIHPLHCKTSEASSTVSDGGASEVPFMSPTGWKPYRFLLFTLLSLSLFSTRATAAPPTITSLSPSSGAVGATVTVAGSGFGSTQGTSTVKFNGTTATITSWSATSIVAKVPAGATTGNVVVTVSGTASNGKNFTVLATPSISS